MLVGKIKPCLESHYYPKIINQVLAYLASLNLELLKEGKYSIPSIDNKLLWFVVISYQTTLYKKQKLEVHRYYSDLQIIISGQEKMAWCLDHQQFYADGDYLPERDIQYYLPNITPTQDHQYINNEVNFISTETGCFYLFTPSTIHATNIIDNQVSTVKKLVVKIHNSLLMEGI